MTLRVINRASWLRDRILILLNAYYIGKLLEDDKESLTRRTYYSSKLSQYYRIVLVRLYYLYEYFGPKRIMNSTGTTLMNIRNLRSSKFLELVSMEWCYGVMWQWLQMSQISHIAWIACMTQTSDHNVYSLLKTNVRKNVIENVQVYL